MTFTPDPAGLDALFATFEPALKAKAAAVVDEAVRIGPRNPRNRSYDVIDRIRVGAFRVTAHGAEQDIEWNSGFWHFVEYGGANQPAARPLTRAVQDAGLDLKDRGRH